MKPKFIADTDKPVKFAFNITGDKLTESPLKTGLNFFEFVDFNEMPVQRALYTLTILNEVSQKLTKERLIAFLDAIEATINSPTVQLVEVMKLTIALRERVEMIMEPESLYKLSSVVYFTEEENPNDYSQTKSYEHIKLFKKCSETSFFLSQPIKKCMPQHNLSDEDLIKYLEIAKKINLKEFENIGTILSKEQKMKDSFNLLKLLNLPG